MLTDVALHTRVGQITGESGLAAHEKVGHITGSPCAAAHGIRPVYWEKLCRKRKQITLLGTSRCTREQAKLLGEEKLCRTETKKEFPFVGRKKRRRTRIQEARVRQWHRPHDRIPIVHEKHVLKGAV